MPGFARFAHKKPSSTIDNGESTSSTPTAGLSDLPSSSSGAPGPSTFSFEGKDREVESSTHRRVSFAQGVNDALDDRSVAEQPSFFSGFDFAEEEEPTANERFMTGFLSDPDDLEGGARSDSFAGASRSNPSYSVSELPLNPWFHLHAGDFAHSCCNALQDPRNGQDKKWSRWDRTVPRNAKTCY